MQRKRQAQRRFPVNRYEQTDCPHANSHSLKGRSRLTGLLSRRNTASHRCYILDTGRSPSACHGLSRAYRLHILSMSFWIKKWRRLIWRLQKNHCMTSYDGIIRIRLKGRSLVTSSQPASQAPLLSNIIKAHVKVAVNLSSDKSSVQAAVVAVQHNFNKCGDFSPFHNLNN